MSSTTAAVAKAFVDTNVLVYANDTSEPHKRQRAADTLAARRRDLVISGQVLGEFFVTVTCRLPTPLSTEDASAAVAGLSRLPVVAVDGTLVRDGIQLSTRWQLSYRDGLILAAARASGCQELLTEDLNADATLAGVEIVNPFADLP